MKVGVFIGRMQPMHNGHLSVIKYMADQCDALVIGIGSSNKARSTKNPFLFHDRGRMIIRAIEGLELMKDPRNEKGKVISTTTCGEDKINVPYEIIGIPDFTYNNQMWLETTANLVESAVDSLCDVYRDILTTGPVEIKLYGHDQGSDTRYLHQFPQWGDPVLLGKAHNFHATDIRKELFFSDTNLSWVDRVPEAVSNFIIDFFTNTKPGMKVYEDLREEAALVTKIKEDKKKYRYPILDQTVDAVVICNGHVLMVTRGVNPGKGQLALPGGYLNEFESIPDGIVRELVEETRIALKPSLLRNLINDERIKCFSSPGRSVRGRIITHCGLINYQSNKLPEVKGSDDAAKAEWIPLYRLDNLATNIFEDHYCIIRNMLGHC